MTETLNKLPQHLQAVSPSHSSLMQIRGCHICDGAHEPGKSIAQVDSYREVNYMGAQKPPQIPRLQPRRTAGIQSREEFHTGLKLEESFGEPV